MRTNRHRNTKKYAYFREYRAVSEYPDYQMF